MSIKINQSVVSPEFLQSNNYKIECSGDECYMVLPDEADEDTALVLENSTDKTVEEKKISAEKVSTTTAAKEKTDVITLSDKENLSDLRTQKGTTFVVVCGDKCGRCKSFEKILGNINNNINDKATIAHLTIPYGVSSSTENEIYKELKKESNEKGGSHGYPIIIKMVDGKATEFYDYSDYSGIYTKEDKMTSWLENKIETTKQKDAPATEVKEVKKTNKGITAITKDNFKEEVRNKKGTTYVIVGGSGCGICKTFEPKIKRIAKELGDDANFVSITLPGEWNKEDYANFETLLKESSNYESGKSMGYPIIIKCVDGKAQKVYSRSDFSYRDEEKTKKWLESMIEGTIDEVEEPSPEDECKDGSCETKVEKDECADGSCETKTEETTETGKTTAKSAIAEEDEQTAIDYFVSQVKSAQSIGALKNLLLETTMLNINTQLKVMDAINGIAYTDDLQSAKSQVINALKK